MPWLTRLYRHPDIMCHSFVHSELQTSFSRTIQETCFSLVQHLDSLELNRYPSKRGESHKVIAGKALPL